MSDANRVTAEEVRRVSPVVSARRDELVRTLLTGLGVGMIVTLLAYLLEQFVFAPLLCGQNATGNCINVSAYSSGVAMLVGALAGLISMTTLQVYRPLLVVLAATASLWSFQVLVDGFAWYWTLLISAILFALAYGLFAWLARIRSFVVALIVVIIMTVLVRLMYLL